VAEIVNPNIGDSSIFADSIPSIMKAGNRPAGFGIRKNIGTIGEGLWVIPVFS